MSENTPPREQELDFNSNEEKIPEQDLYFVNSVENIPDFSDENDMVSSLPETDNSTDSMTVADAASSASSISAGKGDPDLLLSSRYPVNRPPGTPPLTNSADREPISAMEMAIAGKSYGCALRILREHNSLSFEELKQITMIQTSFLEALENEDLDALPPLVYVIAYVRTLCRFYKLSPETSHALVAKLKSNLEYSCNDEILNSLEVDRSGAEANERKIKKILFGISSVVIVLAAVIILLIVLLSTPGREEPPTPVVQPQTQHEQGEKTTSFDPNTIYPLLEPPTLDLPKLPVAE